MLALVALTVVASPATAPLDVARAQRIVTRMKANRRGPYKGVAWYCNDGTKHPPRAGMCSDRGGGRQHGVLSDGAMELARHGIYAGTVLASLKPEDLPANNHARWRALVVERFMERSLNGWVMQSARTYRGARQVEDEERAAVELLQDLVSDPRTLKRDRALVLRAIRALPYGQRDEAALNVRTLAAELGDIEPRFQRIRSKIHSLPDATDIARVESYRAATAEGQELQWKLQEQLRKQYAPGSRGRSLRAMKRKIRDAHVRRRIDDVLQPSSPLDALRSGRALLTALDRALGQGRPSIRSERDLLILHAMNLTEDLMVMTASDIDRSTLTRAEAATAITDAMASAEILGLLSPREYRSVEHSIKSWSEGELISYAGAVERLRRVREWVRATHVSNFGDAIATYSVVEPRAGRLIDELLRTGIMVPVAIILDRATEDVELHRLGGHQLYGFKGDQAVRGENPGISIGRLKVLQPGHKPVDIEATDIVFLREAAAELPPVGGVISLGGFGSLSHVALLAQNLGIPHIVVGPEMVPALERGEGRKIAAGVSADRRVLLGWEDKLPARTRQLLSRAPRPEAELRIDHLKLDLQSTRIRRLGELDEHDSGVRVGPKAAELARLKRIFPDRVADAVVIPFGAFVRHVSRPDLIARPPLTQIKETLKRTQDMDQEGTEEFILGELKRFRHAIATVPFSEGFREEVKAALRAMGPVDEIGVFVRSDTNVEDLENFTGAGLNLTVPNRVGLDEVLMAIRRVWASPYTERSYRWRQSLLSNPEHVYPSVILQRTVPSEKSGVLITTDLETNDSTATTISTSEGVGGVVDGGSAETLVVPTHGSPRLLSSARATTRRIIPKAPRQGVLTVPALGLDPLLAGAELQEVLRLVDQIRTAMPEPDEGAAWDVEFGLLHGRAYLFQIRPLVASKSATVHPVLRAMDRASRLNQQAVAMNENLPK